MRFLDENEGRLEDSGGESESRGGVDGFIERGKKRLRSRSYFTCIAVTGADESIAVPGLGLGLVLALVLAVR